MVEMSDRTFVALTIGAHDSESSTIVIRDGLFNTKSTHCTIGAEFFHGLGRNSKS
jgi:hypothetical protein